MSGGATRTDPSPLRIVHLSTYGIAGGAGRAAHRLHLGLRNRGHDSILLAGRDVGSGDDPTLPVFRPPMDRPSRLRRLIRRRRIERDFRPYAATRPEGYEPFRDDRCKYTGAEILRALPPHDVIHLHWIAEFVDYGEFFAALPPHTPLVWTLHDMNPFTGGCHYDFNCDRFTNACGACPQLGSREENDLSRAVWRRKREAFAHLADQGNLQVVADSCWLADEARRSTLMGGFPVSTIHYGLDTGVFAPQPRATARWFFDLPQEATILLFASESVENRRKGFALLAEAMNGLPEAVPGLYLVAVGAGRPSGLASSLRYRHQGALSDDHALALLYSAADVFVIPSLEEAFGQTALEAMACGTPVVGFDVGGIPDMIIPGVTGLLAPPGDVAALRSALAELLNDPEKRRVLSANCRTRVREEHTLDVQARRYEALYHAMLREQTATAKSA